MKLAISRLAAHSASIDLGAANHARRLPRLRLRALLATAPQWRRWVRVYHAHPPLEAADLLAAHDSWWGPVKLVAAGRDSAVERRIEFCLPPSAAAPLEGRLDDGQDPLGWLQRAVAESVVRWHLQTGVPQWRAPEPERLATWLRESGYEALVDQQGQVRFSLQRPACTGRVLVTRRDGRLRLTLPLGRWSEPAPEAIAAMQQLALQANRATRLARVVWQPESPHGYRCEAQVDLSGTAWQQPAPPGLSEFWKHLLGSAARCLDAVFQQLAAELAALADPANRQLEIDLAAVNGR